MTTTAANTIIRVNAEINASVEKVWAFWTDPKHIVNWNNASDDWHTPRAENDLRVGGKFISRMEAKDGSMGFDFDGEYKVVDKHKQISYTLSDGREVQVLFVAKGNSTTVTELFEAEHTNSVELQQTGWQAILDNFKRYVEAMAMDDHIDKMHFEIRINANAEKVYRTLIDEKHYREWTEPFSPTSHFIGSWEKGSTIRFLGTDENGNEGGMVSRIEENIPNKYISILHQGIIQNGKDVTSGPEVDRWAGAHENYTMTQTGNQTLFSVDVDSNHEFQDFFASTWPKALDKLKEICEQ